MLPMKNVTVAEFEEQVWQKEKIRVVLRLSGRSHVPNYAFTRKLGGERNLSHLRARIKQMFDRDQDSIISDMHPKVVVLIGDGSVNPANHISLSFIRKSYKVKKALG